MELRYWVVRRGWKDDLARWVSLLGGVESGKAMGKGKDDICKWRFL